MYTSNYVFIPRYWITTLALVYIITTFFYVDLYALYGGKRTSSYPYLSGDTIRAQCDFIFDDDSSFDPSAVTEPSIIFVQTSQSIDYPYNKRYLERFFIEKHPFIKAPYILVTHNSDDPAPGKFDKYLDDPKIIHWFGQNPSTTHPKFTALPIGIPNYYWPWGKTELYEQLLTPQNNFSIASDFNTKIDAQEKKIFLYVNFFIYQGPSKNEAWEAYKVERETAYNILKNRPFTHVAPRKEPLEYLIDLKDSCFVASPRGHGLDCHRTWEALLMGAIPIVTSSPLDNAYENLPVIIIDNWNILTKEFLISQQSKFSKQYFNKEKLYAPYWLERIKSLLANFKQKTNTNKPMS